jgi:hypothetical protein
VDAGEVAEIVERRLVVVAQRGADFDDARGLDVDRELVEKDEGAADRAVELAAELCDERVV